MIGWAVFGARIKETQGGAKGEQSVGVVSSASSRVVRQLVDGTVSLVRPTHRGNTCCSRACSCRIHRLLWFPQITAVDCCVSAPGSLYRHADLYVTG